MALPNLYIIGAPKAGTTSVATWLGRHPAVYWSVPKEPYFWATDYPRLRAHYGFDTLDSYESLFSSEAASAATWCGDGSTNYIYSREAVPQINASVTHPRFVVCLRNPVELLVSYHRTQVVSLNEDELSFDRAWERSLSGLLPRTDPLDPKLVDYPMVGRLGSAVQRLLMVVRHDDVHFVVFDDLRNRPENVWRGLADFLDLGDAHAPNLTVENVSNNMFRSRGIRRLTHRPPQVLEPGVRALRQWSRTTDLPGVRKVKSMMWRPEPRPSASVEIRRAVSEVLRSDVRLLSDLVERDLSEWTRVS